jgi:putative copper export protein
MLPYLVILFVHVLGATIWTGGHLVLALTVLPRALRERNVALLRAFESGYERLGIPALLLQVVTGLWLSHRLVPDPRRWLTFRDPVSAEIGIKLLLLALTIALAADARLRIIPRLDERGLRPLAWHIVPVTVIAVLLGVGFRVGGLF